MMNKARRHELKMLHYKKRMRIVYALMQGDFPPRVNFHAFRSTGKPCSCYLCSPEKYSRKLKHRKKVFETE